ncbi:MAG TPA: ATP phosphoribosyltransferase [Isosphaeraceae bacterium]|jgi:ATP phosphoribosyltransferase
MTAPTPADAPPIRLALPSKGSLGEGAGALLKLAGHKVLRHSDRQYVATIAGRPRFEVVFMRPGDIVAQVQEGRCQLGVTGLDLYQEYAGDDPRTTVVIETLGYGDCRLVVAVPESWIDVTHIIDLVDLSTEFKAGGKTLRVSTKYPGLTAAFFRKWGIYHYQLVHSDGALELHPTLGIADVIVDLTSSGTTLKDNRLRMIEQGMVLESAACLIGHLPGLAPLVAEEDEGPLALLLDALDGVLHAEGRLHLEVVGGPAAPGTATAAAVAAYLRDEGAWHVVRGEIWDDRDEPGWRVTALVPAKKLAGYRRRLFRLGAGRVVGLPARFVFDRDAHSTFDSLKDQLARAPWVAAQARDEDT